MKSFFRQSTQRLILSLLLLLFFSQLWAGERESATQQGLLWKIETSKAKPSYLFGTIHSEDPRVNQLPSIVRFHFEQADSFVLEVLMDIPTILKSATAMFFVGEQTLDQVIGEKLFAQTMAALKDYQMLPQTIKKMKPWAVIATLNVPPPKTGEILDLRLYKQAMARQMPTYGLEKVEEQLDIFERLSLSEQVILLEETLKKREQIPALFEKMHELYLKRDLTALMQFSEKYLQNGNHRHQELFDTFYKRLVDDRNLLMVKRMEKHVQQGNSFIAVGALHLPGEKGLLKLLEKKGYNVSTVY
jgi:uncharacterized protein YbaP (TraB family)